MSRKLLLFSLVSTISATALAAPAPVLLPPGARWVMTAPRADQFAKKSALLLDGAAAFSPSLAARRLNQEFRRSTGLALLDEAELANSGVDVTRSWTIFARGPSTFLLVSVKNGARVAETLEAWATGRLLRTREEKALKARKNGKIVTFARSPGARASSGYVLTGDRALIMLRAGEREAGLEEAYELVEGAAPVKPSVSGLVIGWYANTGGLEDVWLALEPRVDGLDLTGAARRAQPGWVEKNERRAGFIRGLLGSPEGSPPGDLPLRLRVSAGASFADSLAASIEELVGLDAAKRPAWLTELVKRAVGATELDVTSIDLRKPPAFSGRFEAPMLLDLLSLQLVLPEAGSTPANLILEKAGVVVGEKSVRVKGSAKGATLVRAGGEFVIGAGPSARPPEPWPSPAGNPTLACAKGSPVASLRLNGPAVSGGLGSVGLFAAMRNDLLMGAYGFNAEYGGLLRATKPLLALACQEPSGRVNLSARWRFTPGPRVPKTIPGAVAAP